MCDQGHAVALYQQPSFDHKIPEAFKCTDCLEVYKSYEDYLNHLEKKNAN